MGRKAKSEAVRRQVFLVEDHPITREGFAQLINFQDDLQVCGEAGNVAAALTGIQKARPDLVIVDISLAESNGLELIKSLKAQCSSLVILVLSTYDELLYAERAIRAGARGYVMKQAPTVEVMKAIRTTLEGELYLSEKMRSRLVHRHLRTKKEVNRSEIDVLSDRELEVFQMIGNGCTTREIAAKLHVSLSTVETHRAHIKEKLNLANAVELVRRAVEWVNKEPAAVLKDRAPAAKSA
jgi:DNA-binding NarL/FixJ family response regulator